MRIRLMFILAMPIGFGCTVDQGPWSPNGKEPEIPLDSSFKRMTTGAFQDRPESWSPDGRLLAFTSDLRAQNYLGSWTSIWLINIETGALFQPPYLIFDQPTPLDFIAPRFSPTESRIAFGAGQHIYVSPTMGDTADVVATGYSPAWSPDGTQIAFFDGDHYKGFGLYVLTHSNGERQKVCDLEEETFWDLSWSPGGEWLAYMVRGQSWGQEEQPSHIALVSAAGGVPEPMFPEDEYEETGFDWTLDGTGIVFTSSKPGGGVWAYDLHHHRGPTLWMVDPINTPRLSPDGTNLAVGYCIAHSDSEECNIWVKHF